eukprot:s5287_g2.t1
MADSTGNLSGSGRLRRPVWATPPKPLQSLDDPLLRGEALISPTVVSSHAQLPGLPKQPNFPKSASVPAFPAAEKRSPLQPLEHRPSTSAGSDVSVPSRGWTMLDTRTRKSVETQASERTQFVPFC